MEPVGTTINLSAILVDSQAFDSEELEAHAQAARGVQQYKHDLKEDASLLQVLPDLDDDEKVADYIRSSRPPVDHEAPHMTDYRSTVSTAAAALAGFKQHQVDKASLDEAFNALRHSLAAIVAYIGNEDYSSYIGYPEYCRLEHLLVEYVDIDWAA